MCCFSGCVAGVLGLTGLHGFAFYIFAQLVPPPPPTPPHTHPHTHTHTHPPTHTLPSLPPAFSLLAADRNCAHQVQSFMLLLKMGFDTKPYYPYGLQGVLTNGITGGALSFMLFWTLFYDICHLY